MVGAFAVWKAIRKKSLISRQAANASAAHEYFNELHALQKLIPINTRVLLMPGETAYLEEATRLCSQSQKRLRYVSAGTLVLTDKRLIFVGRAEAESISLKDITAAKAWVNAVEVSSSRRHRNQIYQVINPIIWSTLISGIAFGAFRGFIERGRS
jgi:hypothetical protein